MSLLHFGLFLSLLSASYSQVQPVNGKIRVQIGGTAGCPFVARYITESVGPVFAKYGQFLDIEFVPWGKTRRTENGELECQFGKRDCWANRLHRCAIDLLKDDPAAMVRYMVCEFTTPKPGYNGSYQCARDVGLRLIEVDNCMATEAGDRLAVAAESAATEAINTFGSIPYTVINGIVNRDVSVQARERLESVICFALADDPNSGIKACKI
ncbi:unnamed protein product [Leptosia nina]|uniref:Uncharacterized protein n=1 Tax=Leptosia nina TaxID=320188 RepID=A0AAV1JAV7_9NEOP